MALRVRRNTIQPTVKTKLRKLKRFTKSEHIRNKYAPEMSKEYTHCFVYMKVYSSWFGRDLSAIKEIKKNLLEKLHLSATDIKIRYHINGYVLVANIYIKWDNFEEYLKIILMNFEEVTKIYRLVGKNDDITLSTDT